MIKPLFYSKCSVWLFLQLVPAVGAYIKEDESGGNELEEVLQSARLPPLNDWASVGDGKVPTYIELKLPILDSLKMHITGSDLCAASISLVFHLFEIFVIVS